MELLLINYLEENHNFKYDDVEIINYAIDGTQCEVTFSFIEPMQFGCVTETKTISLWDIMANFNYNMNK